MPIQSLTPDTVIHERYHILSLLGQGGMSRVYLATDGQLNIRVAVKENLQTDPQARIQFHREAEILAALSHPNLPRVTDYFDEAATGRQYLVMDYVEGEDLGAIVARQGPLHEDQAVAFVVQILNALEYLHSQQTPIIHRDIKPSNIKITPQGKAMLVDFGIAKSYEASALTMTGARAITPGFAPPEQYGMRTDARSDIYAVGATLYTLLTGQVPPESTLRVANLVTMPALRTLVPTISPQVDNAIRLAMEPDTTRRWADAQAFRAALMAPAAPGAPIDAAKSPPPVKQAAPGVRPATAPEASRSVELPTVRPASPARRSRWPWLALAALAGLLALGGAVLVFGNSLGLSPSTSMLSAQPLAARGVPSPTMTPAAAQTSEGNATQTALAQAYRQRLRLKLKVLH